LRHYPQTDPARLRIIPRGIEAQAFPHAPFPDVGARMRIAARFPALAGDGPLLLLPGRGTRLKGHADALALLKALRDDGSDARLWMPGAREPGREAYVAELETDARALGIDEALAITDVTDAIAEAYAACDAVLQVSRKPESFGRTVIEALSVGRPVIGWAHGGVGELLRELFPDGAVPPFDAQSLLAATRAIIASSSSSGPTSPLPATMPERLQRYRLATMQEATLACYRELVTTDRA
jgi:glycosyltransferase involved in cell wall biosynthesis